MGKKDFRTLFLKEFTKSLISNSRPKRELFPHHPVRPGMPQFAGLSKNPETEGMTASIKPNIEIPNLVPQQATPNIKSVLRTQPNPMTINLPQGNPMNIKPPVNQFHPVQQIPQISTQINQQTGIASRTTINSEVASITPIPQPLPQGFTLIKIDSLIKDNRITAIECAGPGKPLIVRSLGRVSPTRITLSEEEIKKIIETFSAYSRIPMMEGVFKAAVGNTVITAVISDFVGSRFIINKYTPYSLLEKKM